MGTFFNMVRRNLILVALGTYLSYSQGKKTVMLQHSLADALEKAAGSVSKRE